MILAINKLIYTCLILEASLCAVKESSGARLLPLECQYLSKPALTQTAGNVPPPVKYFSFKRKPKSAALRADVISKCEFEKKLNRLLKSILNPLKKN